MKQKIESVIKKIIKSTLEVSSKTNFGKYIQSEFINTSMDQTRTVSYNGLEINLAVPNRLPHWRADTFSSKEPETLEWIDTIPTGAVSWDIGANIGLYSTYTANARKCRVWSFEPSVFNLELLAKNYK